MQEDSLQPNTDSILDRVLTRKHTDDIEQFNPLDVVTGLLKMLTPREEETLRRRYGLHGKPAETLEHIGEQYKVTRERIRQIESGAIQKLRKNHETTVTIQPIADAIVTLLDQHGGVMRESTLLNQLVSTSHDPHVVQAATLFTMRYLLQQKLKRMPEQSDYYPAWQLVTAPVHLVDATIHEARVILEQHGKPMPMQDLVERIRKTAFGTEHQFQLSDEAISSYIDISTALAKNPYDESGLASWGTVVPRRMNDKIYLVLKKAGKPLHFNEITKYINETKFDHRTAYPPTVHNELILNDRYVLVGRGIYALAEWGYKPGVVSDILIAILKNVGQPLSREALVAEVLKQRLVKRNTIHLALTNRKHFLKHTNGTYSLAPSPSV